jgi:hypothetical protein
MAGWKRIVAECDGYPVLIQGLVEDTEMLKKGVVYLGYAGAVEENTPFVLRTNGRIDYGTSFDDQRFAETTVYATPIRVGESFLITEYDDDSEDWQKNEYEITRVDSV